MDIKLSMVPLHQMLGHLRSLTKPSAETGCWIWQGGKTAAGYGKARLHGRQVYVHRVMYEAAHGFIDAALTIDHKCYQRDCINPDHLDLVTMAENMRRRRPPIGPHRPAINCVQCGEPHMPKPAKIKIGHGRYCSRRCAMTARGQLQKAA
jgi:hypothetical protein